MFVQTEITPNPNSLKFIPGKVVSNQGSFEIKKLLNDHNYLDSILVDGYKKADKIASKKVEKIHEIIGF